MLDLRTGYACNNQCHFCDQGRLRDTTPDPPTDALIATLQAEARPGRQVWLAGGEVTLRSDLPTLITAARKAGFARVGIQSNGRILAAPGAARALAQAGLTDAMVAIHSHEPGLHDFLVQAPGAFRQSVRGLAQLAAAGVRVHLSAVLTRSLVASLEPFARWVAGLPVQRVRLHMCRPTGAARERFDLLVPRYRMLAEPLTQAVRILTDARKEVETTGVPFCVVPTLRWVVADATDAAPVLRLPPEPAPPRTQGPPCATCRLAARCQGPFTDYAQRVGWEELTPIEGAPRSVGPRVLFPVQAPCTLACAQCAARDAAGPTWQAESGRQLRQRLVRAAGEGKSELVFCGASPWDHPLLPDLVREASRLGFSHVEVWGPIHPLAQLDEATARKLEGLRQLRVPRLENKTARVENLEAQTALALTALRSLLPHCSVDFYEVKPIDRPAFYQSDASRSVWADCQP